MTRVFNEVWVPYLNVVPVQDTTANRLKSMVFNLKQALCGNVPNNLAGAWRVIGSSNGIAANSIDNWQSIGDIVSAGSPAPHSWILLRSPAGFLPGAAYFDMVIDCVYTDDANVQIKLANSLNPYSIIGATVSNSPANPTNSYSFNQEIALASGAPQRMHFWRTQSGIFLAGFSVDGTGIVERALGCFTGSRQGARDTTDAYPGGFLAGTDIFNGMFTHTNLDADMKGWWVDGTKHAYAACVPYPHFLSPSDLPVFSVNNGRSSISNNWLGFPYDLYAVPNGAQPTLQAYRGRVPDVLLAPALTLSNQFADADDGSDLRLLSVQQLWLPVLNNETVTL